MFEIFMESIINRWLMILLLTAVGTPIFVLYMTYRDTVPVEKLKIKPYRYTKAHRGHPVECADGNDIDGESFRGFVAYVVCYFKGIMAKVKTIIRVN
jgi:hypothetical protein